MVASVYVPNGGKDFDAKMRFLQALESYVADAERDGKLLILCGDLNVALEERDIHPKLRKPNQIGATPDERALLARIIAHGLVDVHRSFEARQRQPVHLVGAVAQHEGDATSAGGSTTCWPRRRSPSRATVSDRAARDRQQRSRSGRRDVRFLILIRRPIPQEAS